MVNLILRVIKFEKGSERLRFIEKGPQRRVRGAPKQRAGRSGSFLSLISVQSKDGYTGTIIVCGVFTVTFVAYFALYYYFPCIRRTGPPRTTP